MLSLRTLLIALQFLTRLPLHLKTAPSDRELGKSVLWYPIIGLLIGSLILTLARLLDGHLPPLLAAALLLSVWIGASGGLHLDGLADSTDAWAGGRGNRQRMLAIMKEPSCGPLGATALTMALILKFAALSSMINQPAFSLILLPPLLGRTMLLPLFMTTSYVRPHGLGAAMHANLPHTPAKWILLAALSGIAALGGMTGLLSILTALVTLWLLRNMMQQHIGGMTGDTAGALVELTECSVIIVCVASTT